MYVGVGMSVYVGGLCVYVGEWVGVNWCNCVGAMVHVWRSKNKSQELALSFHDVGPGDRPQIIKLRGKGLKTEPSCRTRS